MSCATLASSCLAASLRLHFAHIHVKSPNFIGLHQFYGEAYQNLHNWFDRLAERARAMNEDGVGLDETIDVPKGDCIGFVKSVIVGLEAEAEDARENEDPTTQAMIDELLEYLGKLGWQLGAMS